MKFTIDKQVKEQLVSLMKRGGHYQRAAESVKRVFGDISLKATDPLKGLNVTNHGESRIKNAIKYDLNGFCRLITIQKDQHCLIKFLGDHDQCDKWLNVNKGLNIGIDENGELKDVYISEKIDDPDLRIHEESDYSEGLLYKKLGNYYCDFIFKDMPSKLIKIFQEFDSTIEDDEIIETCELVKDGMAELIFDVFLALRAGEVDEAKNRIKYYQDEIKLIDQAGAEKLEGVKSNDQYLRFDDMEADDLKILMDNKSWHEWMLFMHPAQKEIVNHDFSGPARLLGVSGSGKTCIIVRRAVRLAKKYPGEKILILTLNRSLASLIKALVELLVSNQEEELLLNNQIVVTSYWEFCREFLINKATDLNQKKIFSDFVDKHNDNVEEEWENFYKCKNNNDDASILLPLHQTLLNRGIFPQDYIKQEFDWIRSAFSKNDRELYLDIDREGRHIPITRELRVHLLKALNCWEEHMPFVGVTDYLGLSQSLLNYIDEIKPEYRCVLVDEMQDFGTIELQVIRKLCPDNENDLFLSGDIAQIVNTKHHKITQAGIKIAGQNYLKITKNYRNSREILAAAYDVFTKNTEKESYKSDDFEILNPEFANFSSPKPFLRKTSSLDNGFNFSIEYLRQFLDPEKNEKGCIAICGYSYYDILEIGRSLNFPVLDGKMDLTENSIFLSDLDNTKGFEFDRMIIINCNEGIIPNPEHPKEEWFREISKFYIAMTRAKRELIVSYNDTYCSILKESLDYFTMDSWGDHISIEEIGDFEMPEPRSLAISNDYFNLVGREFLYTKKAIGLSMDAQQKLDKIIDGTSTTDDKNKVLAFRSMGLFKSYIERKSFRDLPHLTKIFGPVVFPEIEKKILS